MYPSEDWTAGICYETNLTSTEATTSFTTDWSCITDLPALPATGYYWGGMDI